MSKPPSNSLPCFTVNQEYQYIDQAAYSEGWRRLLDFVGPPTRPTELQNTLVSISQRCADGELSKSDALSHALQEIYRQSK